MLKIAQVCYQEDRSESRQLLTGTTCNRVGREYGKCASEREGESDTYYGSRMSRRRSQMYGRPISIFVPNYKQISVSYSMLCIYDRISADTTMTSTANHSDSASSNAGSSSNLATYTYQFEQAKQQKEIIEHGIWLYVFLMFDLH
jgi:hypothetical protein